MKDDQFISNADVIAYHKATGCPVMKVKEELLAMEPELRSRVFAAALKQGDHPHAILHDPIEDDPAVRERILAAATEAEAIVGSAVGRGRCHRIWLEQERILAAQGIRWFSPVLMNPGSVFD